MGAGNKLQRKLGNSEVNSLIGTKLEMYYTGDTHPSGAPTRLLGSKSGYNISKQIFQHADPFQKDVLLHS